jgi:alpha-tubulin suppressor-like RCC1 family protein
VDELGAVWTVGDDSMGQLGDGESDYGESSNRDTPFQVIASGVARVACGGDYSCALFATGAVQCFGNDYYGELANGSDDTITQHTPVNVTGYESSGVAHVGAGYHHTCLIRAVDGGVMCSGLDRNNQLGAPEVSNQVRTMTQVFGLTSGYLSVEVGSQHSCAVSALGGIKW